jgi:single-stranded DNA-binding protein
MSIEAAFFGTVVRDTEVKTSKNGKQYLRVNVRTGDGDTAQFINTMVFDPEAIAVVDKLVKGARVYCEGRLTLDEWTGQDGNKRAGLSCMSWHTRLSQIGRSKPKREEPPVSGRERAAASDYAPAGGVAGLNDDIPDFR